MKRLAIIAVLLLVLVGCAPATRDDPALANKARSAIAAVGAADAIHDVSAETNGDVIVTITMRASDLGGKVQARDLAMGIAQIVFERVPEAKAVSVFDADDAMVDRITRR